ncbi:autophagy-related protein 16-2 [Protobothrops mucrosquamatus]|uniref:autophagy-related protein 16-2 n=1 Tax=Protobothrops mucrosquamatus TaxID=103944 RepID=UPI0007757A4F|nr:autophagy-related protein 16-2 [Protobothrops mucrosquamatus]
MAEGGGGGSGRRRWKRHILRQLQQRDRAQKARFSDLLQAYTKLLEKPNLDHCSVQFQIPSVDHQTAGPACSPNCACPACVPNAIWDSAILLRCLQNRHEAELSKLETANGELAYKIYERGQLLRAKDAELEDQTDRLASLSRQLCDLEDWRCRLRSQAEELSRRNGGRKAGYDSLQRRFQQQDGEFRQALEKGEELLQRALRRKADWAQRENDRIERVKQTQLTRELQAATRSTLGVKIESEKVKTGEQKSASKHPIEEKKGGEKLWKRPFRSASASSLSTPRYKGFLKGWFELRRGNSISSGSVDQYGCLPSCADACLPSCVADEQEGHLSEIHAVAFSPNSGLLATGGVDRVIKLWSVAGGCLEEKQTLDVSSGSITSIAFDPLGCCILAATYDNAAQLWKVEDRKIKEILTGHTNKVTAAKFRSTWQQAVTGSRDRTVKEWDLVKGACSRTIEVFSCCYDVVCCNNVIVSGHYDKMIRFWDTRDPHCTQVVPVGGKVTSLSLSPDQLQLLSCSRDNALKVIDLRMHTVQQVFRAEGFKCGSEGTKAVFSPDKRYALVGSSNGALFLWNLATGKLEISLAGVHRSSVNAVAWGPSGVHIGSVDKSRKVVLWK